MMQLMRMAGKYLFKKIIKTKVQEFLILKHITATALQLQAVTVMLQNLRSLNSSYCWTDSIFF